MLPLRPTALAGTLLTPPLGPFFFNTYLISSSLDGYPLESNLSSKREPRMPKILKPYILGMNLGGPVGLNS